MQSAKWALLFQAFSSGDLLLWHAVTKHMVITAALPS